MFANLGAVLSALEQDFSQFDRERD